MNRIYFNYLKMNRIFSRFCSTTPISSISNLHKSNMEVKTILGTGGIIAAMSLYLIRDSESRTSVTIKDSEERMERVVNTAVKNSEERMERVVNTTVKDSEERMEKVLNRVVTELEKRLHNKLKSSENRLNKKLDELFMKTGNGKDKADSVVNTKTD